MTQIKKVKTSEGVQFYPQTHTKAVIDDNGYSAESRLQAMQDEINQAQLEVGAVPSDLAPTEGSTNWVTSGGVYNATTISISETCSVSEYSGVRAFPDSQGKWMTDNNTYKYYGRFVPIVAGERYKITARDNINCCWVPLTNNTYSKGAAVPFATGYTERQYVDAGASVTFVAPSDATYLYLASKMSDYCTPTLYIVHNTTTKYYVENADNYPQKGSESIVRSKGLYELLYDGVAGEQIDLGNIPIVQGWINSSAQWFYTYNNNDVYSQFIPVEGGANYVIHSKSLGGYYAFMTSNVVGASLTDVTTFATGYANRMTLNSDTELLLTAPDDAQYLWVTYTLTTTADYALKSAFEGNTTTLKAIVQQLRSRTDGIESKISAHSTKRFPLSIGFFSASTGMESVPKEYILGYLHTPKFTKANDSVITIKTLGFVGYVYYYDENFAFISRTAFDTTSAEASVSLPTSAIYFRLGIHQYATDDFVDIEGIWSGDDNVFAPRPSNGYKPFTFAVKAICPQGDESTSSMREQYRMTTDSGMLHLPSNYKNGGEGTPLIIYVHGAGTNYTTSSTTFPANNPLAPEWDAAGFAQMDLDLIPDLYNDKQNNAGGGSSDDAECIFAAYRWVIDHFNIRRDGVYLIGRSRGGQAVLQTLSKYNPSVMPIVCAISNGGAHALINYGIINSNASALWNLLCESYNLPTDGRPSASGNSTLIMQNGIYNFLAANIDLWWKKASVGASLMAENKSEYQTASEILQFLHEHSNSSSEYLGFLEQLRFRSPVPLRFDWCTADTIQSWNANDGRGNYSRIMKDGFVKNLSGNAEYREWPTVDTSGASITGVTDKGHWHELYNKYDGDYTLPNGAVVTNPSMARVEWLLWCMSHDNRFNYMPYSGSNS